MSFMRFCLTSGGNGDDFQTRNKVALNVFSPAPSTDSHKIQRGTLHVIGGLNDESFGCLDLHLNPEELDACLGDILNQTEKSPRIRVIPRES